jgi:hypothetical protein
LKHFHSDLKGREEKDETIDFPLVQVTETEAFFDGMTFRRAGDDGLQVFVSAGSRDVSVHEFVFKYRRSSSAR